MLDVLSLMNVSIKLTTVFLSTVPMKIVSTQVQPNVSITTKVSLVIFQLVYGPRRSNVLTLTNATPMTEKVISMLIASMM